jgi:hypothetical protein
VSAKKSLRGSRRLYQRAVTTYRDLHLAGINNELFPTSAAALTAEEQSVLRDARLRRLDVRAAQRRAVEANMMVENQAQIDRLLSLSDDQRGEPWSYPVPRLPDAEMTSTAECHVLLTPIYREISNPLTPEEDDQRPRCTCCEWPADGP